MWHMFIDYCQVESVQNYVHMTFVTLDILDSGAIVAGKSQSGCATIWTVQFQLNVPCLKSIDSKLSNFAHDFLPPRTRCSSNNK